MLVLLKTCYIICRIGFGTTILTNSIQYETQNVIHRGDCLHTLEQQWMEKKKKEHLMGGIMFDMCRRALAALCQNNFLSLSLFYFIVRFVFVFLLPDSFFAFYSLHILSSFFLSVILFSALFVVFVILLEFFRFFFRKLVGFVLHVLLYSSICLPFYIIPSIIASL